MHTQLIMHMCCTIHYPCSCILPTMTHSHTAHTHATRRRMPPRPTMACAKSMCLCVWVVATIADGSGLTHRAPYTACTQLYWLLPLQYTILRCRAGGRLSAERMAAWVRALSPSRLTKDTEITHRHLEARAGRKGQGTGIVRRTTVGPSGTTRD